MPARFVSETAPFLTADLPGTGGTIRESDADFCVEELSRRVPAGRGGFALAWIEKRGLSTPELLRRIGAALGLRTCALSAAGFKDAHAIARQWIAMPWEFERKLATARIRDVEVLRIERDDRPLFPGDLSGNRFAVKVRGIAEGATARAEKILGRLKERGVPAYFGIQRFGVRGEAAELGRRLLMGERVAALDLILGAPSPRERDPRAHAFREAYERGDFRRARELVPGRLTQEARLLDLLVDGRGKRFAAGTLSRAARRFAFNAWQALWFNRIVAQRVQQIDQAIEGDLLVDARGEVRRRAPPESRELPPGCLEGIRAQELHPSAPLLGADVELAAGAALELEQRALVESGVPRECLHRPTGMPLQGERRAIRFRLAEERVELLRQEQALLVSFVLPPGCFATTVLGEITKSFAAPCPLVS
jgi:tRNA pseudouridine13 synthase